MRPGDFFAAAMRSATLLYGLSARTASTVGSAVKRATGTSCLSGYIGSRPRILSVSGMMEIEDRASSSV